MRRAATLVIIAVLLGGCTSSTSSDGDSGTGGGSGGDPAYMLAENDDALSDLPAYSAALDDWQSRCKEDRATVAGYVDATYNLEQKNGGPIDDTSRLDVMRHLTDSVPPSVGQMKCDEIAGFYLTLVEHGSP